MIRVPPGSTRMSTLFPSTTLFVSAHAARGLDDAACDFTTVGDQDFLEQSAPPTAKEEIRKGDIAANCACDREPYRKGASHIATGLRPHPTGECSSQDRKSGNAPPGKTDDEKAKDAGDSGHSAASIRIGSSLSIGRSPSFANSAASAWRSEEPPSELQ